MNAFVVSGRYSRSRSSGRSRARRSTACRGRAPGRGAACFADHPQERPTACSAPDPLLETLALAQRAPAGREGRQRGEAFDRRCAAVWKEELQNPGRGRRAAALHPPVSPTRNRASASTAGGGRSRNDTSAIAAALGQFIRQPSAQASSGAPFAVRRRERPGPGPAASTAIEPLAGLRGGRRSCSERVPCEPEQAITRPGRRCATVGRVTPHRERQPCVRAPRAGGRACRTPNRRARPRATRRRDP